MVRNKYYVVRKLADVIYALPVGQGIVRDYPVMQLGAKTPHTNEGVKAVGKCVW